MSKKTLIVSPYLDHLGGGERYMLSIASVLESLGHEIYMAWDNLTEIASLAGMLGIKLSNPQLDPEIKKLYTDHRPLAMYSATAPYDVVVYLSNGSIPLLGGKRNILHMQVPFHGVRGRSWKNQIKNHFIHAVIVNSAFTKKIVDTEYGIRSRVVYPPVAPVASKGNKEPLILSVGRFEPSLNTKHQDILIQAFRLLSPQLPEWKMVLAGGSGSKEWVQQLKRMASGLPIEIKTNISHNELAGLYSRSSIYWHGAGYGVDENNNPELTEHFGISTVEAISAGCTPLVVPYGGQREIVGDPQFHWTTIAELIQKSTELAKQPTTATVDISRYSLNNFREQLTKLIT